MSYRVEFLELALLDLSSIVSHVANELGMPIAAKNLAELIVREVDLLKDYPYSSAVYVPVRPLEHIFRRKIVHNYSVFYWVEETSKTVTVARILYNKRDVDSLL